jgi:hypothetical protein
VFFVGFLHFSLFITVNEETSHTHHFLSTCILLTHSLSLSLLFFSLCLSLYSNLMARVICSQPTPATPAWWLRRRPPAATTAVEARTLDTGHAAVMVEMAVVVVVGSSVAV